MSLLALANVLLHCPPKVRKFVVKYLMKHENATMSEALDAYCESLPIPPPKNRSV